MPLGEFAINSIEFSNKIAVAPMCQYSAEDGNVMPWHKGHLFSLLISGAGMLMLESCAVTLDGRITHGDLALETEENVFNLNVLYNFLKQIKDIPIGIQISHAGRKGSSYIPWKRNNTPLSKNSWQTYAPSSIPRDEGWPVPRELSLEEIMMIVDNFYRSAELINYIGFEVLEIHMAHGYLLHQFFSPISNHRFDMYGGSNIARCRMLLLIAEMVRGVWPKEKVLGARVNGMDWIDGGSTIDDCVYLTNKLKEIGFDYVCVSSGGILPMTNLPNTEPEYQVHLSRELKKSVDILTRTSGMITKFSQMVNIIKSNSADMIAIGRKFIKDPTWMYTIQTEDVIPFQYRRCL